MPDQPNKETVQGDATDEDSGDEQQYIYAIAHPHGYVKLGRSKKPQARLKQHQTSTPYDLWIVAQVPVENSREVEKALHERFDDRHVSGEWYELGYDGYDDIVDMVRMAASNHEFQSVEEFKEWQERKREAML